MTIKEAMQKAVRESNAPLAGRICDKMRFELGATEQTAVTGASTVSRREQHKGAMIGEKATDAQIALWKSLGLLDRNQQRWTASKTTRLAFRNKVNPNKW